MCAGLLRCLGEHTFWPRLERVNKASETLGMVKEDFDSKREVNNIEGCVSHGIPPVVAYRLDIVIPMRAMAGEEPGLLA